MQVTNTTVQRRSRHSGTYVSAGTSSLAPSKTRFRGFVVIMTTLWQCFLPVGVYAFECPQVTLYYIQRPPYLEKTAHGVGGLAGDRTEWAFEEAGIPFQWMELPTARQIEMIRANTGCDCLVNYFKTAEREQFGKYTHPLYQDQPHIAVTRAGNLKLKSGGSVDVLLSNPDITLEIKKDWSYGAALDHKIMEHHPKIDETMGDNSQLLKKIQAGRADFFFTTAAEADALIAHSDFRKEEFVYITFNDMAAGEKRYLFCSMKVNDTLIEQLNTALDRVNAH